MRCAVNPSSFTEFKEAVALLDGISRRFLLDQGGTCPPYKIAALLAAPATAWKHDYPDAAREALRTILTEEIAELTLPALLDRGANHLAHTRLREQITNAPDISGAWAEKIALLADSFYVNGIIRRFPRGYGFVSYPGYMLMDSRELVKKFPGGAERYFEYAYPVIYELQGLKSQNDGSNLPGWLAFFFIKPASMRAHVPLVKQKTEEAARAIEQLNGAIVGLGGLSASYTEGGVWLAERLRCKVTTGHAYTTLNIVNMLEDIATRIGLPLTAATVAVIGAAGSVGQGAALLCARRGVKKLILIDPRGVAATIEKLRPYTATAAAEGRLPEDLRAAHAVIAATSSADVLFTARDFRPGAVILDDSQPKNVAEDFMRERDDIIVLEAGAVALPAGASYQVLPAFGPKLKPFHWKQVNLPMAGEAEVPSCLAEAMIWSSLGEERDRYSLGKADPEIARHLQEKSAGMGFAAAPPQCFGRWIEPRRIEKIRQLHRAALTH